MNSFIFHFFYNKEKVYDNVNKRYEIFSPFNTLYLVYHATTLPFHIFNIVVCVEYLDIKKFRSGKML